MQHKFGSQAKSIRGQCWQAYTRYIKEILSFWLLFVNLPHLLSLRFIRDNCVLLVLSLPDAERPVNGRGPCTNWAVRILQYIMQTSQNLSTLSFLLLFYLFKALATHFLFLLFIARCNCDYASSNLCNISLLNYS